MSRLGILTAALFVLWVGTAYALYREKTEIRSVPQIILSPKLYTDSAHFPASADGSNQWVIVKGTLAGDGVLYTNNTNLISCWKDQGTCEHYAIGEIAPNQMGSLVNEHTFEIKSWTADEISGVDTSYNKCVQWTLRIGRKSQEALIVQEPINQSSLECKDADREVHKWTLEDSPWWSNTKKALADSEHGAAK